MSETLLSGLAAALLAAACAVWLWRRNRALQRRIETLRGAERGQTLRETEAKLAVAQKIAHLGYWEWDLAGDRLWWSPEEYEILGYPRTTRPTLEGFFDRVHPEDRERIREATRRLIGTPAEADIEFRIIHPELGTRHLFSRTQVITDAAGRARKLIGTEQDLTAHKLAEEALGESERRYRHIFDAAPVALWEQDYTGAVAALEEVLEADLEPRAYLDSHPDLVRACARRIRVLDVNDATLALLGVDTKEQLLGPLEQLLTPADMPTFRELLLAIAQRRRHFSTEAVIRDLAGRPLHVLLEARLPGGAEEAKRVLMSMMDISNRKRAERERERLIAELEAKNAELERFTYTVSHDLRSPLVTIKGFLGLLEKDAASGDLGRLRADLDHVEGAADNMWQLLGELLRLSRVGRIANPPERVGFDEIAREATSRVAGPIRDGAVEVVVQPGLPTVYGDRLRLVEVLQNLVENAVRFMGDQPRPRVEIGARPENRETVFFVRDNGMGIPREHHERVFGLFERLDPRSEGTGVGLALVKRIVEVHGGRIWVESAGAGAGTTFCLTLAAGPGDEEIAAVGAAHAPESAEGSTAG